jgi:hypothetical protein
LKFVQDDKNNKTPFRQWGLPPTHITSSIQPSSSVIFAGGWVHYHLLNPTAKITELLRPFHHENGLQTAVKAFLKMAVCDETMLDQWIPDEDWVCQIREINSTQ